MTSPFEVENLTPSPSNHFFVQTASLAHASQLASLHALCFTHAAWGMKDFLSLLSFPTTKAWVCLDISPKDRQKEIVGLLFFQASGHEGEVLTLAVHPAWRKRGIARSLLQKIFTFAINTKIKEIFLEVSQANTEALALYHSLGFVTLALRKGYYSHPSPPFIPDDQEALDPRDAYVLRWSTHE